MAILTTLLFQILSNLANDYGDGVKGTDNEERVGQQEPYNRVLFRKSKICCCFHLYFKFCICLFAYLFADLLNASVIWYYVILAILCIIAAITYTSGKKGFMAITDWAM
ncbi:MAG: hypothetical protein R2779_05950 [Crocinitomicaceae bacterium]